MLVMKLPGPSKMTVSYTHLLEYEIQEGEGAFYGPKIEFALRDCLDPVSYTHLLVKSCVIIFKYLF